MPVNVKRMIADTFLQLSKEKRVDKITVKDLVERCGISRQTFYYHFQDILEVIEWSVQQAFQALLARSLDSSDPEAVLRDFIAASAEADVLLQMFDLKLITPELHRQYTGAGNAQILANARHAAACHPDMTVCIPLIPGCNNSREELSKLADFIASLPGHVQVDLHPYSLAGVSKYGRLFRPYTLEGTPVPTPEQTDAACRIFRERGLPVMVGG